MTAGSPPSLYYSQPTSQNTHSTETLPASPTPCPLVAQEGHVGLRSVPSTLYLSHVNDSHCQGLVAQDGAVLVSFPPLQHDLKFVAISLEEVWVLGKGSTKKMAA